MVDKTASQLFTGHSALAAKEAQITAACRVRADTKAERQARDAWEALTAWYARKLAPSATPTVTGPQNAVGRVSRASVPDLETAQWNRVDHRCSTCDGGGCPDCCDHIGGNW